MCIRDRPCPRPVPTSMYAHYRDLSEDGSVFVHETAAEERLTTFTEFEPEEFLEPERESATESERESVTESATESQNGILSHFPGLPVAAEVYHALQYAPACILAITTHMMFVCVPAQLNWGFM